MLDSIDQAVDNKIIINGALYCGPGRLKQSGSKKSEIAPQAKVAIVLWPALGETQALQKIDAVEDNETTSSGKSELHHQHGDGA